MGVASLTVTKEARHLDELFQNKVVGVARRVVARREAKAMLRAQAETVRGGRGDSNQSVWLSFCLSTLRVD